MGNRGCDLTFILSEELELKKKNKLFCILGKWILFFTKLIGCYLL